jgi:hypothetical protein
VGEGAAGQLTYDGQDFFDNAHQHPNGTSPPTSSTSSAPIPPLRAPRRSGRRRPGPSNVVRERQGAER